jgi:hypothetical protein
MFYRKVKKFCFVVGFFIWIVIKNCWCDVKSVKKLKCFLFDFFGMSEMGIGNFKMGYQTVLILIDRVGDSWNTMSKKNRYQLIFNILN